VRWLKPWTGSALGLWSDHYALALRCYQRSSDMPEAMVSRAAQFVTVGSALRLSAAAEENPMCRSTLTHQETKNPALAGWILRSFGRRRTHQVDDWTLRQSWRNFWDTQHTIRRTRVKAVTKKRACSLFCATHYR